MFPNRYFGSRYFTPRYFPGGSPPLASDYFGNRYFNPRYFGANYWGPHPELQDNVPDYFGNRYFAKRYFGLAYWGPGRVSEPDVEPPEPPQPSPIIVSAGGMRFPFPRPPSGLEQQIRDEDEIILAVIAAWLNTKGLQ